MTVHLSIEPNASVSPTARVDASRASARQVNRRAERGEAVVAAAEVADSSPRTAKTVNDAHRAPRRLKSLPVVNVYAETKGGCLKRQGPCGLTYCRYHLGTHAFAQAVKDGDMPTCTLDVAENGPQTHSNIGSLLGFSRERSRQIEEEALGKLRALAEHEGVSLRDLLRQFSEGTTPTQSVCPPGDVEPRAVLADGTMPVSEITSIRGVIQTTDEVISRVRGSRRT